MASAKIKWSWDPIHAKCFEIIKKKIARETLLTYPEFSKPFEIHTDASKVQLGVCISQDGKPIAFYSRKLNFCNWFGVGSRDNFGEGGAEGTRGGVHSHLFPALDMFLCGD
jgi:hypothetical protein